MLRILHLEDSRADASLIQRALIQSGLQPEITLVSTPSEFAGALEQKRFDLILADSGLPGFGDLKPLEIARQKCPTIPFICLSGSADEQQIRANLQAGASDYVLKDHDWQLGTAIQRALQSTQHQQEIERLRRLNQAQARLVLAVQELSLARDLNGIMAVVRRTARDLTGADGATFVLREGDRCHYADEDAIAPLWKGQRFPMSACISGWTMLHRQPAIIEDIYADPRIPADAYRPTFVKSLVMVPIRAEAPIGAIGNYWATRHLPAPEELELLQALANTTAVAMEKVQVYSELERRVHERTAQLEAANRELEAYSYAVSHDLGAPVRSIRGLTELLAEESANTLSAESQVYLQRIQGAAGQMRRLIDDLLRLSKISISQMTRQRVNLSELAHEILSRLSAENPQRQVVFQVVPGLDGEGDPGLVRIVLENLLGNAWKYTAKCAQPRIEFGAQAQADGTQAFFVRDNGAGFDMQCAGQLFQPFRRLHSQTEFAGSGIGLATVQRIIQRHGGRIWAEAAVGQGATFYFTLGCSQASVDRGTRP